MIEALLYNSDIGWAEWWRPLLYMFAHANIFHLAANLLCLFLAVKQTKRYFPSWITLPLCYVTCVLSTLFIPRGMDIVGVSAGIYGIIGMWVLSALTGWAIEIHSFKKFGLSCLWFIIPTLIVGIIHPASLLMHSVGFCVGGLLIVLFYLFCELFNVKSVGSWRIKR